MKMLTIHSKCRNALWIHLLSLIGMIAICNHTYGQKVYGKSDVWLLLLNGVEITDQWSVGNELHLRYDDGFRDKEQLLIRPFVNYKASEQVVLSAGYTYIKTYPYGKYPLPADKPEHNVWEQITLKHSLGKASVSHRYRIEQRFLSTYNPVNEDYNFSRTSHSNRFRYRLTLKHPIGRQFFLQAFDEFWIKSDSHLLNASFDRNWMYVGIGRKFGFGLTLQLAYLHQNTRVDTEKYERHPTAQLTIQYDLKLN